MLIRSIARLSPNVLAKLESGGGANFAPPNQWVTATYGSGWPIAPVTAPNDVELPRTIDYPISVNATLTPRTGYGLMPFSALLEAYENVAEVRTPVELIHRELRSFVPHLVDDDGNEVDDHPFSWMAEAPDRQTPFSVWMTRYIKSSKVYDAPSIYFSQGHDGHVDGLHYIDGSTLFLIVDEYGNVPKPEPIDMYVERTAQSGSSNPSDTTSKALTNGWPMGPSTLDAFVQRLVDRERRGEDNPDKIPAYCQIIKGTPFSWWSADQIWYMPFSRRMNSPYGESFIEMAWSWVMVVVNITAFELGHYRTGNMPEGFVTMPGSAYTSEIELRALELAYNARMSAGATERMRLRFFPDGAKWIPTKKPDFPKELYMQAWKNILHAIGVPPSEFGDIPGSGLGGKGFKEGAMSELSRNTLNPIRETVTSPFNYILEREGVDDVHFELSYPTDEIDPDKLKQGVYDGMSHGTLSLNDALGELNLNPVGDPDDPHNVANKHLIVAASAIYVVEDMQTTGGMAVPTFTGKPTTDGGSTGGTPVGPDTSVQHTPEDTKTVKKLIENAVRTGRFTLDNKTYHVMPARKEANPVAFHSEDSQPNPDGDDLPNLIAERRIDEAQRFQPQEADNDHGVGIKQGNINWQLGLGVEAREHPGFEPHQIEQIVRDHLREDPEYYKPGVEDSAELATPEDARMAGPGRLFSADELRAKGEQVTKIILTGALAKHCGVDPEDDEYFGAPISREVQFVFPDHIHANAVEIVAMIPEGLPPKPALWKPEGGELEGLQDWIGGPQYVREEAAYLLDRALGFYLVPVAYVAEADDEHGAAIFYTSGASPAGPLSQYNAQWIERAAVLDYVMSQTDRHEGHNYLTHPDDPSRLILIDNGLGFPVDPNVFCASPFCEAMLNVPLSSACLKALTLLYGDAATWHDIQNLVGVEAAYKARVCAKRLLDNKMVTHYTGEGDAATTAGSMNYASQS